MEGPVAAKPPGALLSVLFPVNDRPWPDEVLGAHPGDHSPLGAPDPGRFMVATASSPRLQLVAEEDCKSTGQGGDPLSTGRLAVGRRMLTVYSAEKVVTIPTTESRP